MAYGCRQNASPHDESHCVLVQHKVFLIALKKMCRIEKKPVALICLQLPGNYNCVASSFLGKNKNK